MADDGSILALDVGAARIGLSLASTISRLARPAGALTNDEAVLQNLRNLCQHENVTHIVVGLPRGLGGQETRQTAEVRRFAEKLAELKIPISWQDEAVTSAQAEAELQARRKPYTKSDIDALAATYILEDYLR